MNPIKLIRKLAKALRGGATFTQVFLGVFLGFALGLLPGVNLCTAGLLLLLLLLNVNGGVAMATFLLSKLLCLVLAPVTFRIGYALIHSLGLSAIVAPLGDTPVLALLDLHIYCLMGGIPLALVLGGGFAYSIASFFQRFHKATSKASAESERYQKLMTNRAFRILLWLVAGGEKKEAAMPTEGLLLKGRLLAGGAAMGIACLVSYFYLDTIARHGMVEGLQSMTGAEVNVESVKLSLLGGAIEVQGVQLTDPARPTHNQMQAAIIKADLDVAALLTRQLVLDEVLGEAVKTDSPRSGPGDVYVAVEAAPEPAPLSENLGAVQKIRTYYEKVKSFKEKADTLRDYLESNDPANATGSDKDRLLQEARLRGYLGLSAKDTLSKHPTWHIKKLSVHKLEINPELPTMKVEGTHLSSAPSLSTDRPSIRVLPDDEAVAALKKELDYGVTDTLREKAGGLGTKIKGLFD